jgi:hypothetical protein
MAKTILDLFRDKAPVSSLTNTPLFVLDAPASETYSPRNSKDLPIRTNNVILNNTSVPAINLARRIATNHPTTRKRETYLEQTVVGLLPLQILSSPFIYGTALPIITQRRHPVVDQMKQANTPNAEVDRGVIGGVIQKASEKLASTRKRLGFPTPLNPTSYADKLKVDDKSEIPQILSDIKNDSSGTLLGKLLSQPQTPNQLVRNAIGTAVGTLKNKARGELFGERSTTGFNTVNGEFDGSNRSFNYGSAKFPKEVDAESVVSNLITTRDNQFINAKGVSYSKTIFRLEPTDTIKPSKELVVRNLPKDNQIIANRNSIFYNTNLSSNPLTTNESFIELNEEARREGGIISKVPETILGYNADPDPLSTKFTITPADKPERYSSLRRNAKTLDTRGIIYENKRYVRDVLNNTGIEPTETTKKSDGDLDDIDFIPLKFTLLHTRQTVRFRSIIDGISETFSPTWDSSKFIGSPFNYYTYGGVERSVSFNLKVVAGSISELKNNWERLKFLASLVYPVTDDGNDINYIIPPFIKFTLGSMYVAKEGYIESLSYAIDDVAGWEIGTTADSKNHKLPKKIDISFGIKFLETKSNSNSYTKLYGSST